MSNANGKKISPNEESKFNSARKKAIKSKYFELQEEKSSKVYKDWGMLHRGGEILFETQWKYNPILSVKESLRDAQGLLHHSGARQE